MPASKASNGLSLDIKFVSEQGQKFFPITHRKAIMGLSDNTLTLSQSLDIDVSEADNMITINPLVQSEIDRIDRNLTDTTNNLMDEINTQIENLWTRVNAIKYAGSDKVLGPANTAYKLDSPFVLTLGGHAVGNVSIDGSKPVTLNVEIQRTKNNYAGASVDGGVANSAVKLETARTISLTGAVTGSVNFDGTGNVSLATSVNHNHDSLYSKLNHNHDAVYSKLGHAHNYAGSSTAGGVANSAAKLSTARTISLTGAVTGSVNFDGTGNVSLATSVNHNHDSAYAAKSHTHDDRYFTESEINTKLGGYSKTDHNHDSVYSKLGHSHDDKYYTETEINSKLNGYSTTSHNHDSAYAAKSHTHDDRYFTESEINTKLGGYSKTDHNHDGSYLQVLDRYGKIQIDPIFYNGMSIEKHSSYSTLATTPSLTVESGCGIRLESGSTLRNLGDYYQNYVKGQLTAVQSTEPNSSMVWAW